MPYEGTQAGVWASSPRRWPTLLVDYGNLGGVRRVARAGSAANSVRGRAGQARASRIWRGLASKLTSHTYVALLQAGVRFRDRVVLKGLLGSDVRPRQRPGGCGIHTANFYFIPFIYMFAAYLKLEGGRA